MKMKTIELVAISQRHAGTAFKRALIEGETEVFMLMCSDGGGTTPFYFDNAGEARAFLSRCLEQLDLITD